MTSSAAAHLRLALGGDVAGLALVVDLAEVVARARHVAPPEDLHRLGRAGLVDG